MVEGEIHIMDVQSANQQQLCDRPESLNNVSRIFLNLYHKELMHL